MNNDQLSMYKTNVVSLDTKTMNHDMPIQVIVFSNNLLAMLLCQVGALWVGSHAWSNNKSLFENWSILGWLCRYWSLKSVSWQICEYLIQGTKQLMNPNSFINYTTIALVCYANMYSFSIRVLLFIYCIQKSFNYTSFSKFFVWVFWNRPLCE